MSKRHAFDKFVFLQTVIFLSAWLWLLEVHLAEMGGCCPPGGQNYGVLQDAPVCLMSPFLFCQTLYSKIQWLPFSLTYLLTVWCLEGMFRCSIQRFLCPYAYVSFMKFESLLAPEDVSVNQPTRVHNYLQMQLMVIIKFKLMNPVQGLNFFMWGPNFCWYSVQANLWWAWGSCLSSCCQGQMEITSSSPHDALCNRKCKISVFLMIF